MWQISPGWQCRASNARTHCSAWFRRPWIIYCIVLSQERAKGYKKKDFKQAKFDFTDEMLRFSLADRPAKVLDVGCGIGGTTRYLAKKARYHVHR